MVLFLEESSAFSSALAQLAGKSVVVLGHRRPDGDCIGSQVALTRVLLSPGNRCPCGECRSCSTDLAKVCRRYPFFRPDEVDGDDVVAITVDWPITSGWGMSLPLDFRISS